MQRQNQDFLLAVVVLAPLLILSSWPAASSIRLKNRVPAGHDATTDRPALITIITAMATPTPTATTTPSVTLTPTGPVAPVYLPLIRRDMAPAPPPDFSDWMVTYAAEKRGDYLYTLIGRPTGGRWLSVLDVSNPTHPVEVSRVEVTAPASIAEVEINEDQVAELILVLGFLFDVSDPQFPVIIHSLKEVEVLQGNYTYASRTYVCGTEPYPPYPPRYCSDLWVYDISNPDTPEPVTIFNPPGDGSFTMLAAVGDYLYLGVTTYRSDSRVYLIRVIETSDPISPTLTAELNIESGSAPPPYELVVEGNRAYLFTSHYPPLIPWNLAALDISNPAVPEVIVEHTVPGGISDLVASGSRVYISVSEIPDDIERVPHIPDTVKVLDVSTASEFIELGSYRVPEWEWAPPWAGDLYTVGNYIYVNEGRFFRILEISDPTDIIEVGRYEIPQS